MSVPHPSSPFRRVPRPAAAWLLAGLAAGCLVAAEPGPMRYLYHPPESALDRRYEYQWRMLELALERTVPEFGPYEMKPSAMMTERRQRHELMHATGALTLMYLSPTPELEARLWPVRIPIDKNLGGYGVFLVRREDLPKLAAVREADQLRAFTFGLGQDWVDVGILRASGLRVVTGSSYDGLFEMLANGRFDLFPRGAVEILDEFEQRRARLPNLAIEPGLVFYYPLPMYFWFSRTPEGRRLAARVDAGLRALLADGTFDRVFDEFQREKIRRLALGARRIIRIENPNLGPETPFADRRLWFDPATYRLDP
ncbi:MAG: ABC transporter substrate-binding protein [Opitutaceae bacterium]|nr:ABC transporter substrate-binding protein [Opitutaceae bacterium]